MLTQITALTGGISATQIDQDLVTSKAMNLANDGIVANARPPTEVAINAANMSFRAENRSASGPPGK